MLGKAVLPGIFFGSLLVITMNGFADSQSQTICAARNADILKETTVKLQLLARNYRVKNIRFNPRTNCFHMKGYDPSKRKIIAIVDPYTGDVLDMVEAVNATPMPR